MDKKPFNYTYSASQQEEINKIRKKYDAPKVEENKLEQLRRLDKSVTKLGTVIATIFGIISSLILGIGMCCTMVWGGDLFVPGIIIGVVGIVGISGAYPLYSAITKRRREKLAPEIIRLSDELIK